VANHHSARPISATSGTSFSVVVTIERSPTARVLLMLTSVSSQTQPTASSAGRPGVWPIHGKIRLRLLTTATAIAPLPAQIIVQ
jgi:hypothetical protein